jgi:hypothetical protein
MMHRMGLDRRLILPLDLRTAVGAATKNILGLDGDEHHRLDITGGSAPVRLSGRCRPSRYDPSPRETTRFGRWSSVLNPI